MATWKSSTSFKFRCPHTQYENDSHSELTWEYQTTSDSFRAILNNPDRFCAYTGKQIPADKSDTFMSKEHALAFLEMMENWNEVYNK